MSAAPSSTSTLMPLPRSSVCADFANVAGDFCAAGVLTASRAQIVASAMTRPRSSAVLDRGAALADHHDAVELRRLRVGLVLEVLVRAEREPLGDRLRDGARVDTRPARRRAASSPPTSPSWPCGRSRPRRCGRCRASGRREHRDRRAPRPWPRARRSSAPRASGRACPRSRPPPGTRRGRRRRRPRGPRRRRGRRSRRPAPRGGRP